MGTYAIIPSLIDPNGKLVNYTVTVQDGILGVTPATLTVCALAANKTYDGTTAATVTLTDNRLEGDKLTVTYQTATFSDDNCGQAKTVNVAGIAATGPAAANYLLPGPYVHHDGIDRPGAPHHQRQPPNQGIRNGRSDVDLPNPQREPGNGGQPQRRLESRTRGRIREVIPSTREL